MIVAEFNNSTEETLSLSESYMSGLFVSESWEGAEQFTAAQIILPGNIRIGSTYEEVLAMYGMPGNRRDFGVFEELIYSTIYAEIQIIVDKETSLVSIVGIRKLM